MGATDLAEMASDPEVLADFFEPDEQQVVEYDQSPEDFEDDALILPLDQPSEQRDLSLGDFTSLMEETGLSFPGHD